MTKAEKNRLLLWNSIIWIAAMVLPFALNLTLGSTKFPWPILLPLLLIGFGCNSHISLVWLSDLRVIRVHACGAIT